jgi:Putative bacterial sensory transduction regulator
LSARILLCALLPALSLRAQTAPTSKHFERRPESTRFEVVKLEDIEVWLDDLKIPHEREPSVDGKFYLRIGLRDFKVLLFLFGCKEGRCTDLQVFSGFQTQRPLSLARINEWNRNHRFTKAYLNERGDSALEADLSFTGNLGLENFKDFLNTFKISLSAFAEFLNGE